MNTAELIAAAERLGTPLYVFDTRTLLERVALLRRSLPEGVRLCYAVKANTFIIPALAQAVDTFEVCSEGEARICLQTGVDPAMLVISGVNKNPDFIDELVAADAQPHRYTVESLAQFDLLRSCAERHKKRIPLLLRLTSGNQFGLDVEDLVALVRDHLQDPAVQICGVQYFSGTQKTSTKRLARELRQVAKCLARLEEECGFVPAEVEFGPGFPVTYFDDETFDETAYLEEFSAMLREFPFAGTVTLELGRSVAASCGTFLTSVVDAKTNAGQRYAIVDGGMNHLVYFGQSLAMRQPRCTFVNPEPQPAGDAEREPELWNICGSLCSVNDILAKQLDLPGLGIGSLLAFEDAGAYCMTEGISLFLSRDLPGVCLMGEGGEVTSLREAVPTHPLNCPAAVVDAFMK